MEVSNDLGRGFSNTRQFYGGPRSSNPLASTDDRRTKYTTLFLARHTAPASLERLYDRMMDPDDLAYTKDSFGEVLKLITDLKKG